MKAISDAYKKEIRKSIQLALPIVIAQLGVVLMNVSDNIMIGRILGKEALASAALSNSLAFLIGSLAIGAFPVIAPIISKHQASKNSEALKRTFSSSLQLALWYSLALSLISFILYYNFNILGQKESINNLSKPFFVIISLSNIPLYFFLAAKQTSDGLSHPKIAMIITFFGLAANILFNYVLIKGFWVIPPFGLNGAAYSTLFVRALMFAAILLSFTQHSKLKNYVSGKLSFKTTRLHSTELLWLSIPGGLQFLFEIGAFSFAVIMMGWISENALAAHQIAINVAAVTYMMASGIAYSGGIRVGHGLGLKNMEKMRTSANVAYFMVMLFMSVTMVIIFTFRISIVSIYLEDLEILHLTELLLGVAAVFQLSDGIQVVALGNLRGISDVKIPAFITFIAYWIITLPLGYFLAFKMNLGALGIWYALLIGLSLAGVFLTFRFYRILNKVAF